MRLLAKAKAIPLEHIHPHKANVEGGCNVLKEKEKENYVMPFAGIYPNCSCSGSQTVGFSENGRGTNLAITAEQG